MQVNIRTEQSFSFSAKDIAELVAAYLRENHQVTVNAKDVKFDINAGYSDQREYEPAALRGATVTVTKLG